MSDLINRQAAIEAVSEACFEWRGVFGRCENALNALPSAEPQTKIPCGNCQEWDCCGCDYKQTEREGE